MPAAAFAIAGDADARLFAGEVDRLNKARAAGRRRRVVKPPRVDLKVNAKARRAIAGHLREFFVAAVARLVDQVAPTLGKADDEPGTARDPFDDPAIAAALDRVHAASDTEELEAARAELQALIRDRIGLADLGDWSVLINPIAGELDAVFESGGLRSLNVLSMADDYSLVTQVHEDALDYAVERAAELVGMRRNEETGTWEDNPNSAWRIDETTRGMVASDVATAIEEGWSTRQLADQLEESTYGFSEARAETIARTEIIRANNAGNMAGYRDSGVVSGKIWLAGNEGGGGGGDEPCDDCQENADEGVIGLDEDFPSGDDAPPAHPNCRCAVAPVTDEEDVATSSDAEGEE